MAKNTTTPAKELRERGEAELKSLLATKQEELQKVGFKHALGQLRQTHQIKVLRREIARLATLISERKAAPARAQG